MRLTGAVFLSFVVAACAPPVPDSGAPAGTGFDDYTAYRGVDETLPGATPDGPDVAVSTIPDGTATATAGAPADGLAATATTTTTATSTDPATGTRGISDEQDFAAVSERETIESDAERLRRRREEFQVIEPTPVPTRTDEGPNAFAFALSTTNPVGQKIYSRSVFASSGRAARNCARYATADDAQEAFLGGGGPERDRLNLDPDGDGFACGWDPAPYRHAAAVARQ